MRNSGSGNKIQVGGFYGYAVFGRNGGDIKAYLKSDRSHVVL